MVAGALKCPFCESGEARPYGTSNGKKQYTCKNPERSHKTFYAEYRYNGWRPGVKKAIIKWAVDGAGIRTTARGLEISTDTVIKELKKENQIEYVNKEYFETRKNSTIALKWTKCGAFIMTKTSNPAVVGR